MRASQRWKHLTDHWAILSYYQGLAAITLVLGVTYWLMRERDDRLAEPSKGRRVSDGTVA